MRSKTRSYIGVVFLALILAFVAFQMRDSVEVLQPVMPIIFVAFASLAVAGVAGFLFDLMESKLELPDWLWQTDACWRPGRIYRDTADYYKQPCVSSTGARTHTLWNAGASNQCCTARISFQLGRPKRVAGPEPST